jgi:hypothetical protein
MSRRLVSCGFSQSLNADKSWAVMANFRTGSALLWAKCGHKKRAEVAKQIGEQALGHPLLTKIDKEAASTRGYL